MNKPLYVAIGLKVSSSEAKAISHWPYEVVNVIIGNPVFCLALLADVFNWLI